MKIKSRTFDSFPQNFDQFRSIKNKTENDQKVESFLFGLHRVCHVEAQLVHVDFEYIDHIVYIGELFEHVV